MILLLVQLILLGPTEFMWAAKQVGKDTSVVVNYPNDAENLQTCVWMYDRQTDLPSQAPHCWTPRSVVGDVDVWEDFTYAPFYVVASLQQRLPSGDERTLWAWPDDTGPDR